MASITTRSGKGSPLTNAEVDANFTSLNTAKLELTVDGVASGASITPAYGDTQYNVTALATDATINAPSGTPSDGMQLLLRIKDDGTSRSLTWNSVYASSAETLPSATTAGKVMYLGFRYNSTAAKLQLLALAVEA